MTTTLAAKTAALLLAGRVTVLVADGSGVVMADVEGDTLPHRVTAGRGGFTCTCKAHAHGHRCSHITAVALIVDSPCRVDAVAAVNSVTDDYLDPIAELERARFAVMQHSMWRDHGLELLALLPEGDESIAVLIERLGGEGRKRALELVELLGLRSRLRGEP